MAKFFTLLALTFFSLLAVGVVDVYLERKECSAKGDGTCKTRIGLHQNKRQAHWLYFFISHIYDNILNPWHWTPAMRDEAVATAFKSINVNPSHKIVDVGAGTGFTSMGVLQYFKDTQLTMVDLSAAQLAQAAKKPELNSVPKLEGDAENLPFSDAEFDYYVSAGSIEYWPDPQKALHESYRVLRPNGQATIIGPARPTHWLSKIIADSWYLFPDEEEYREWFGNAGFQDITVHHIIPDWYGGDRSHGLIMGCVVSGRKSAMAAADDNAARKNGEKATSDAAPQRSETEDQSERAADAARALAAVDTVRDLGRFLLGSVAASYYVVLPVAFYLRNVTAEATGIERGEMAALAVLGLAVGTAIVAVVLSRLLLDLVYGGSKRSDRALFKGIARFYDVCTPMWERRWGVHMHSGFYKLVSAQKMSPSNKTTDRTPVYVDRLRAQEEMISQLLSLAKVDRDSLSSKKVLDLGCGVGGSSFALRNMGAKQVVGVTLSKEQVARANERARKEQEDDFVSFQVANAEALPFPDASFDIVWSLESAEHFPNKVKFLQEAARVLKPGGTLACATWCRRSVPPALSYFESKLLSYICYCYFLPPWVSLQHYLGLCSDLPFITISTADWSENVKPFWLEVLREALQFGSILELVRTGFTGVRGAMAAAAMAAGFKTETIVFGAFCVSKVTA